MDADSDSDSEVLPRKIPKRQDSVTIVDDSEPSTSRQASQSTSSKSSKQPEVSSSSNDKILKALTMFIVEDLHSSSIIKDAGFKRMMLTLKPDLVFPTQDDILNNILLLYGIEKSNLMTLLHGIDAISIAIERWTSFTDNTYATIKANFINEAWEPQSYVLATVQLGDPESFKLLNDKLFEVLKDWEIEDKIVSTVYDW